MADNVFQLQWYCRTGVWPRGAHVRQRCGRSLNPLSSMKTMVRPSFLAFFLTSASDPSPLQNLGFVPFPGASRRSLATPTQLPQNAPCLRGIVLHSAFVLDQLRHTRRRPQGRFISECLWATLQTGLDSPQVFGT